MRFKATLKNVDLFLRIFQTIDHLAKTCALHLSPTEIHFIEKSHTVDEVHAFAGLNVTNLFSEYKITSKAENNVIVMTVSTGNAIQALKSSRLAHEVTVKLSKKGNNPVLCFTMKQEMVDHVSHDVPVDIIPPSEFPHFAEPPYPKADVQIVLPRLSHLKPLVERMKGMSDHVYIEATNTGELSLSVQTDSAKVTTQYTRLQNAMEDAEEGPPLARSRVKVSLKHLHKVLYTEQIRPDDVICVMGDHELLICAVFKELYFSFYLPVQECA